MHLVHNLHRQCQWKFFGPEEKVRECNHVMSPKHHFEAQHTVWTACLLCPGDRLQQFSFSFFFNRIPGTGIGSNVNGVQPYPCLTPGAQVQKEKGITGHTWATGNTCQSHEPVFLITWKKGWFKQKGYPKLLNTSKYKDQKTESWNSAPSSPIHLLMSNPNVFSVL